MIETVRAAVGRRIEASSRKEVSRLKKTLILVGFCLAQLLDITTTHIGLSEGRQELNGVAAWIITHDGEVSVYVLKGTLVLALVAFLLFFGRRRTGIWNAYMIAAWITAFAVMNNLYRILT